jgi:hypothetical protein
MRLSSPKYRINTRCGNLEHSIARLSKESIETLPFSNLRFEVVFRAF